MPSFAKQHDKLDCDNVEICHAPLGNWASEWYRFYASQIFQLCQIQSFQFHMLLQCRISLDVVRVGVHMLVLRRRVEQAAGL